MTSLNLALTYAVELRQELDDTVPKEIDLGYGGLVHGWPNVPRRMVVPQACKGVRRWMDRLRLALDILGMGISVAGESYRLFYRDWKSTGLLDAAVLLREAFKMGLFGPRERVATATLRSLAEYLKCKPARSNREQMLAVRLEEVGFSEIGQRRCLYGTERVLLPDDFVTLELTGKKFVSLAPTKHFAGPKPVDGDDVLAAHVPGFDSYLNSAQRDVVHELCDPNGSPAVIARLPTGGGKSLCYFLAAAQALSQQRPHTAVVVSPIVALQNDQVLQVANKLNAVMKAQLRVAQINMTVPLAERKKIYGDLFRGNLHVLFLSPEKLLEPFFRETLLALAEQQRIGFLVIDEAHIVPEWGRDFRTHFHRLGVIREDLQIRCPSLKTLILSATLTEASEKRVMEVLRLREEDCKRITIPHIRREISVRVERYDTRDEKLARLLEIAPHLPRPAIIYSNRKDTVRLILRALKDAGIYRCFDYTGDTAPDERIRRLHAFHRGDVRFVVGTNAFGLGIDKQDVRSVIHFDVPHSLDACYQEIGRSARDGHTGHAIIFYSPRGMGEATRRGRSIITSEKAWDRAHCVLTGRYPRRGTGQVLLPAHAVPRYMREEGKADSPLNREWNLATLNILERQGLVDVKGIVYRNIRVTKPQDGKKLGPVAAEAARNLAKLMGRRQTMDIDVAEFAYGCRQDISVVHSHLIILADAGAISLEPLDEDREEMWVLAELDSRESWSPEHMTLLEAIREQDLIENNAAIEALRRFFKAKGCRLRHFAELYGFERPKPCGHCDRCSPRLAKR